VPREPPVRGLTPGVAARLPVLATLPSLLQDDPFLQRFTAALDDVLVPLDVTLDGLASYVDPRLAPEDFLDWLASWVGLELDARWPVDVRRALACSAAALHEARGTAAGLADELALLAGAPVHVSDPGGVVWSQEPGSVPCPDDAARRVAGVRVTVCVGGADREHLADPDSPARQRLVAAARAAVPPHLPVTVEVSR
jgi:phage tail-like protein